MSDFIIGVEDEFGNVLGRPPVPLETMSTDHNDDSEASLPREKLYDRDASEPFFTTSNPATDLQIKQDTNLIANCGVHALGTEHEVNGVMVVIGSGEWVVDELDGSTPIKVHQDISVRPGERLRVEAYNVGTDGDGNHLLNASIAIQNRTNGRWLVSNGNVQDHFIAVGNGQTFYYAELAEQKWQDAEAVLYTFEPTEENGNVSFTADIQVEDRLACHGQRAATLRIILNSAVTEIEEV